MVTRWTTWSWSAAVAAASLSLVTACSIMWLAISRPDELARSLGDGRVTPLVQALAAALVDAVRSLASWL